jgi:uncharacterized protein (DUF849 family)
MDKFIVTAALTGAIHTPTMSPYLPITPDEIAADARRASEAGAAVVHVHARDPETGQPSADSALFGEILSKIRSNCDAVVCTTTGGGFGMTVEQRVSVVKTYSPELASLNAGSLNFALHPILDKIKEFKHDWEPEFLNMSEDYIFPNTFKTHTSSSMAVSRNRFTCSLYWEFWAGCRPRSIISFFCIILPRRYSGIILYGRFVLPAGPSSRCVMPLC